MRAETEALKRCDKHGLNFDPRLTRGCVLCRRSSDGPGGSQSNKRYTLSGFALIAALVVFGWIYVKPLIAPDSEARHSFVGLSPITDEGRHGPLRENESSAGGASAKAAANADPSAGAAALHPIDAALWSQLERSLAPYENGEPIIKELRDGFGIHVHVPRAAQINLEQGKLAGTRPTQEQITSAARALASELGRYPREFVSRMGLQHLVLIDGLRHKGEAVGAFAVGPAFALFADPEALADDVALHHELFHFVDYRLHGTPADHRAWIALNPPGTRYRAVMRQSNADSTKSNALRRDLPGFVTEYAQADAAEDMAEVFQLLMMQRPELYQLTSADPVIAAKVTYVIQALDRIAPNTSAALNL